MGISDVKYHLLFQDLLQNFLKKKRQIVYGFVIRCV